MEMPVEMMVVKLEGNRMKEHSRRMGILMGALICVAVSTAGLSVQIPGRDTPHGYDYFILRDGLNNCRVRFEDRQTGRVAFLGGSITAMTGWRNLVQDDLRKRFPNTSFDFIDAGIGSLDSTAHAFRFSRDILKNGSVDLLFVEAAVNDSSNRRTPIEQLRGMEGIVRQARMANPEVDIVMLHFVDPGKMSAIKKRERPEVILTHENVASNYAVPSIDLAQEVTERILAGEFTWETDFVSLHPSPFGHGVYARSVSRLFDAAWPSPRPSVAAQPHVLPELLDPNSYFTGKFESPSEACLGTGFHLDPSWAPADQVATRAGFVNVPVAVAETPGSALTFSFTGSGIGLFVVAGPDAGTIEYRIDNGAPVSLDLYTPWSRAVHLPWVQMLAADLVGTNHVLELTVSANSNASSLGHAVRIVNFLTK